MRSNLKIKIKSLLKLILRKEKVIINWRTKESFWWALISLWAIKKITKRPKTGFLYISPLDTFFHFSLFVSFYSYALSLFVTLFFISLSISLFSSWSWSYFETETGGQLIYLCLRFFSTCFFFFFTPSSLSVEEKNEQFSKKNLGFSVFATYSEAELNRSSLLLEK